MGRLRDLCEDMLVLVNFMLKAKPEDVRLRDLKQAIHFGKWDRVGYLLDELWDEYSSLSYNNVGLEEDLKASYDGILDRYIKVCTYEGV